jgi:hypothetical protein
MRMINWETQFHVLLWIQGVNKTVNSLHRLDILAAIKGSANKELVI